MNRFDLSLKYAGLGPLRAERVDTIQVNLGKMCNQACAHCHQNAGPNHTETMASESIDLVLQNLKLHHIPSLDITGGAPELHPDFRRLVVGARKCGASVMNRCNLTALLMPEQTGLARFLRDNRVRVVASLPCYTSENVDAVRGTGVFDHSLEALKLLNGLGYGFSEDLRLDLVYNPQSPTLPPPAERLEEDYRRELSRFSPRD